MRGFWLIAILLFAGTAFGQAEADSVAVSKPHKRFHLSRPQKALILSAALPGLGQAYNRKYWKIPVVWAGIGFTSYMIVKNKREYRRFDRAYRARYDDDPNTIDNEFPFYSDDAIYRIRRAYDQNVQKAWIWTGVMYGLNMVDAFVDAHLRSFDVSDDLTLSIHPALSGNAYGIGLTLKAK